MTSRSRRIGGIARVDAAVFRSQPLEDEQRVKLAALTFDVQVLIDGPVVFEPGDLHGQIAGRDGAGDLRAAATANHRREVERFDDGPLDHVHLHGPLGRRRGSPLDRASVFAAVGSTFDATNGQRSVGQRFVLASSVQDQLNEDVSR